MIVDLIVLLCMIGYGISGYRRGAVAGLLALGGFVGGAVLGMRLGPAVAGQLDPGVGRAVVVVTSVLVAAWVGQILGSLAGRAIRDRLTVRPAQAADQALGAVAGVLAVALVLWFVAGALRAGPSAELSRALGQSRVLTIVDRVVPSRLATLADDFRSSIAAGEFPRVFSGLGPEGIAPVEAPDPRVAEGSGLRRAVQGVVKVTGESAECQRGQEGSGYVSAPQRVVTNAHVVAGLDDVRVQVGGVGRRWPAEVVVFDPVRDVAVLSVPGLPARALATGQPLERRDSAVVAGFPRNGPFRATPARVRRVVEATGDDIYGRTGAEREVYELRARIEPGNSGGPMLDPAGRVVGVVFARSQDDATTGYALTMDEVRSVIARGRTATSAVSTGACLRN